MPLSDIVAVQISTQNPGVTRAGFGVPLILSQSATWTERTRVYTDLDGVASDFAAASPEYNAARAVFAQTPRPEKIRIGRAANRVLQQWALSLADNAAQVGATYKVHVANAAGVKKAASHVAIAATAWATGTSYDGGALVVSSGKLYLCTGGGTSTVAPTGTDPDHDVEGEDSVSWRYAGAGNTGDASSVAILFGLRSAMGGLFGDTDLFASPPASAVTITSGGGSASATVAASSTASEWFALEVDDGNTLRVAQTHAAPGSGALADDLTACAQETADWYGLLTLYNSAAYVAAAAAWCEATQKLYVAATADTACAVTPNTGASDVLHALAAANYARTGGFFHPRATEFADAAEMGRFFPIPPGGDNWRLKTLAGVTSGWANGQQFTATQIANLNDRHANFYYDLSGASVVGGDGMVAAREYIDVIRGRDWWVARVQERVANLLIKNEKVPFTDDGIALVETEVRAQNAEGVAAGLINPGSPPGILPPSVAVPKSGAVSQADRQDRRLGSVKSAWTLAGAINKLTVQATISP